MNTRFQISMKRSPSASALPGGPPGILSPWSKKNSRAWTAGAGVAIARNVRAGDADDARFRKTRDFLPQRESLVVVDIDGGEQGVSCRAETLVISVQACSMASA